MSADRPPKARPVVDEGQEAVTAAPRPAATSLEPQHLYKAALLLFALAVFYQFFREVTQTLLLLYAASIVAIVVNPVARRLPVQRKLTAAGVGVVVFAAVGVVLWLGVPALIAQLRELVERAPEFQAQLEEWADWIRATTGLNVALIGDRTAEMLQGVFQTVATGDLLGRARGALEILLVPLIILMGGLYAVADPNRRLLLPLLRAVPQGKRDDFRRIFRLLGERLFDWIRGTLIAMVAVGALTSLALYLIGVPYWLLLGTLVGLLEFIVIFGPWIGGVPVVLIAFLDEPMKGLWAALAILAIQQMESYLITPWAMSQAARIHPLVTLFALVFFGSIFGVLGILLALPLVILFWTVTEVLWVERALGAGGDRLRPVVEE
jgi:predicted PurR-regulated permease PerM